MKVVIENIVAQQRIKGELDPHEVQASLSGFRFQPDVFKGLIYEMSEPHCELFLLPGGTIRIHGVRSILSADRAFDRFIEKLRSGGFRVARTGSIELVDVTSSHDLGCRLDPSKVLEEFKGERIIYDPTKLPGFTMSIPSTGIDILIFPEGKIISTGADSIEDSASSLELVKSRLSSACIPKNEKAGQGA